MRVIVESTLFDEVGEVVGVEGEFDDVPGCTGVEEPPPPHPANNAAASPRASDMFFMFDRMRSWNESAVKTSNAGIQTLFTITHVTLSAVEA